MGLIASLTWLDWLLMAVATWHVAALITKERGPWGVLTYIRTHFPLGGLTTCIKCTLPWVGFVIFGLYLITPIPAWLFAVSGLGRMLASYTGVNHD